MIEIINICKKYEDKTVLDKINLSFEKNKIYALLGRNGEGKSTLMNIISGRILPTSGQVKINGRDVNSKYSKENEIFSFTDMDLLNYESKLKDIGLDYVWLNKDFDKNKFEQLLKRFNLNPKLRAKSLSTGQKSIFKVIIALCLKTQYLLLDEPILGLDATTRSVFYDLLLQYYLQTQTTIIISTHLIDEISHLIEDVVIIKDHQILIGENVEVILNNAYKVSGPKDAVQELIKTTKCLQSKDMLTYYCAYVLSKNEIKNGKLLVEKIDLQTLFIKLTGEEFNEK